jgi:hypothetical protein
MNEPHTDPHPCQINVEEYDHDWRYESPDPDVGLQGCWVCAMCGALDPDRDPPSGDDDD